MALSGCGCGGDGGAPTSYVEASEMHATRPAEVQVEYTGNNRVSPLYGKITNRNYGKLTRGAIVTVYEADALYMNRVFRILETV